MTRSDKKDRRDVFLVKIIIIFYTNIVIGKRIKEDGLIYILEWTPATVEPFNFLEKKQKAFVNRKCEYQNCFLTSNHNYFSNVLYFDVLMFNVWHLSYSELPSDRSPNQKYIMVAMEPAGYYPVPEQYNEYFNLTWTYKLDSDVTFPYIVIKNQFDEVIGPKLDMQWTSIKDMNETSDYVKSKLKNKYIAAAWIVSNCHAQQRLSFVSDLKKELAKYGHRVDVYGQCGDYRCPRQESMDECYALIERDYYFYLAFENSFGVDYVSEKLLHGLEHFAVPVVLGGANYSRFMPDGIYLNALSLGPAKLAKKMSEIINDMNKYYEFFKWHGYYSFHFTGEDAFHREVCGLCELLNDKTFMNRRSIYSNIVEWWNTKNHVDDGLLSPQLTLILEEENNETGFVSNFFNSVFDN